MKTFFKRLLGLGVLAAAGYAVWRALRPTARSTPASRGIPSRSRIRRSRTTDAPAAARAEAVAAGTDRPRGSSATAARVPASHPVKAKLASGIFHVPGGANYARTQADRCYVSPEAAEADGLRAREALRRPGASGLRPISPAGT